jgi:hypothetical protein
MGARICVAAAAAFFVMACSNAGSGTGPSKILSSLTVSGPSSIAPGATGTFVAMAHFSDGTSADYSNNVGWSSTNLDVLNPGVGGQAVGRNVGEAQIKATDRLATTSASANVMVVPTGTFRLNGRVLSGTTPLAGATVSIASGTGMGATTTTDSDGQYRLYGVAGVVQVQVVELKYNSLQQSVTVTNNAVADFTLTPTPAAPSPTPPSPSPPSQQSSGYELTGVVIGDDGRVLSGATIYVNFQPGGGHFVGVSTVADGTGKYDVTFNAVQGGYLEGATALVFADADGYEAEFRWFRPASASGLQTLDLHPRAIRQITAGESTSVTVTPDDTPCINNAQDFPGLGPDYFCRTIRVMAPSSGQLTIAASPQDGQPTPVVETEIIPGSNEDLGNPRTLTVAAGQIVKVNVELRSGLPAQSFQVTTSLAGATGTSGTSGPRNALRMSASFSSNSSREKLANASVFLEPDVPVAPETKKGPLACDQRASRIIRQ